MIWTHHLDSHALDSSSQFPSFGLITPLRKCVSLWSGLILWIPSNLVSSGFPWSGLIIWIPMIWWQHLESCDLDLFSRSLWSGFLAVILTHHLGSTSGSLICWLWARDLDSCGLDLLSGVLQFWIHALLLCNLANYSLDRWMTWISAIWTHELEWGYTICFWMAGPLTLSLSECLPSGFEPSGFKLLLLMIAWSGFNADLEQSWGQL